MDKEKIDYRLADREFTLDRHGGPEKISRAMYSPKAYRRSPVKPKQGKRNNTTVSLCILGVVVVLVLVLKFFIDG